MKRMIGCLMVAAALAGCNSLRTSQSNHFSDNDGNVVKVDFCHAAKDHTVRFLAPSGQELEAQTKLAVRVELPNGQRFTAWKTLNPSQLPTGTAYKTDNGKYLFWAHGFSCAVLIYDAEVKDYAFIFDGILTRN